MVIRIPIAQSGQFSVEQSVEVPVQDSTIVLKPLEQPKLSLAEELALFDPAVHGGEVMASIDVW